MAVRLSKRLTALAVMVTAGNRLADIGTDHGYIPVFLCREGIIPSAIAMDVREGPLARAREHVAEYGLSRRIETRLSDGLERLRPGEADTVLIAGMGGALIIKILSEGSGKLAGVGELIVQPQSEAARVRRYLREAGFVIADEDMVCEDGKFYPMIKARKADGSDPHGQKETCGEEDFTDLFGPVLLGKRHPVLLAWIGRELAICDRILAQIGEQPRREAAAERARRIGVRREYLLRARDMFTER